MPKFRDGDIVIHLGVRKGIILAKTQENIDKFNYLWKASAHHIDFFNKVDHNERELVLVTDTHNLIFSMLKYELKLDYKAMFHKQLKEILDEQGS